MTQSSQKKKKNGLHSLPVSASRAAETHARTDSLVELFCRKSSEMFGFYRFSHISKRLWIKWVTNLFFWANFTLIFEKWLWLLRYCAWSRGQPIIFLKNEENQLRKFCFTEKENAPAKFWVWLRHGNHFDRLYHLVLTPVCRTTHYWAYEHWIEHADICGHCASATYHKNVLM